jgi:two-component sensor histidine kinase
MHLRNFLFLLLLLGHYFGRAQYYSGEFMDNLIPELGQNIHFTNVDQFGQLLIYTGTELIIFDGEQKMNVSFAHEPGKLLYLSESKNDQQIIVSENGLFSLHSRLDSFSTADLLIEYDFLSGDKVVIDTNRLLVNCHEVLLSYSLDNGKLDTLALFGSGIKEIAGLNDTFFIVTDSVYKLHRNLLTPTGISITATRKNLVIENEFLYSITQNGSIFQLDLVHNKGIYLGRLPSFLQVENILIKNELMWIACKGKGLVRFDIRNGQNQFYRTSNGLCFDRIHHIASMYNGDLLWLSSEEGLCRFSNKEPQILGITNGLEDTRITAIDEFQGSLWFSTGRKGLANWNGNIVSTVGVKEGLKAEIITDLHASKENLWIAGQKSGLIHINHKSALTYVSGEPLVYELLCIDAIDSDSLFLGTTSGIYACFFDELIGKYQIKIALDTALSIRDMEVMVDGRILFVAGQTIFSWQHQQLEVLASGKGTIRDFSIWDGNIYAAVDNGLWVVNLPGLQEVDTVIHSARGVQLNGMTAVHVIDDTCWFALGASSGFLTISPQRARVKNVQILHNFAFHKNAFQQIGSEKYVGTAKGLFKLSAKVDRKPYNQVFLSAYWINGGLQSMETRQDNKHIVIGPFNASENHLGFLFRRITLWPQEDGFSWSLIGKDLDKAGMLTSDKLEFYDLEPGEYTLAIRSAGNSFSQDLFNIDFDIKRPFWASFEFKLLLLMAFIGLSIMGILMYLKINRQKEARKRLELEQKNHLLELEQRSLQLQMNPHFIFNSLNSIQGLIGRDDKKAKRYVARLSRLMRNTLQHTRLKWIALEEEVEILSDYMEVEKQAKGLDFNYRFEQSGLDENIMIPPMMIQPIVENSIKHAFKNLDREGMIWIKMKYEGRQLCCIIEDNGSGLTSHTNDKDNHLSIATLVINERLQIYRRDGNKIPPMERINLSQEGGEGTRVILRLPYKLNDQFN